MLEISLRHYIACTHFMCIVDGYKIVNDEFIGFPVNISKSVAWLYNIQHIIILNK